RKSANCIVLASANQKSPGNSKSGEPRSVASLASISRQAINVLRNRHRGQDSMAPEVEPNINPIIWTAIEQKRLLRFRYKSRERIVEPHYYGIHKGMIKLFGYQVAGSSSQTLPNWRWAEQGLISDLQLLDQTFPGGRPTKSGKHQKWDKLFIRVKPADKNKK